MPNPSFAFIVGAPRCGTTSLARYLKAHPAICFSRVKEPHFFSQHDLTSLSDAELREVVEREYLARYFPRCAAGTTRAEGSVTYLYVPDQLAPILRLWPDARFIIAVRDPLAMLPSLHQRLRYLGDETVADFNRAWALTGERRHGRSIPRSCIDPRWLYYDEIGRLGHYLERFFDRVGRERCFVAVYDDLAADPAALYREILAFLDLPDDGRTDFAPRRARLGFRSAWLQRLLKRPPKATRALLGGKKYRRRVKSLKAARKGNSAIASLVLSWRKRLLVWNKAPAPPVRVSAEVRENIRRTFADDVERLGKLIGRNLGHWLGGAADVRLERDGDHPL